MPIESSGAVGRRRPAAASRGTCEANAINSPLGAVARADPERSQGLVGGRSQRAEQAPRFPNKPFQCIVHNVTLPDLANCQVG